ncbi:L-type lectin-domain containing protein [Actinoplanes siamensis]|uniref:Legume lectin domain-containing protein n=1 Tax=Actinoplanes siamensis TaxID=1223317 RepID=A0A919NDS3_9ACTN|nr:L-type lectin-domain containing protein [Actinoplanes siamensis]GIF09048.1 hypothetical protein Asi03nite_65860 [Actinoplanes siamensis]
MSTARKLRWTAVAVTAGLLSTPAPANAGTPVDSLSLNGSATIARFGPGIRVLRLTNGGYEQMGSAWANRQIDINKSFESTFVVYLHHGRSGADGVAFILQASGPRALGGWGGGLGYRGLKRSVAVEFDDFRNGTDPNDNHIALVVNNNPDFHLTSVEPPFPLFRTPFVARVVWDAPAGRLRVYASPLGQGGEPGLVFDQTVDLRARLGTNLAWIGFTGATGGVTSVQDILSWQIRVPR